MPGYSASQEMRSIHFIGMCGDTDTIVIHPFVDFLPQFLQNPERHQVRAGTEG